MPAKPYRVFFFEGAFRDGPIVGVHCERVARRSARLYVESETGTRNRSGYVTAGTRIIYRARWHGEELIEEEQAHA